MCICCLFEDILVSAVLWRILLICYIISHRSFSYIYFSSVKMLLFTQFRQSVSSLYFCIIAQHSLSLLFLYPLWNGKNVLSLCVWDKFSHLCNNRCFHKLIVHSLPCNEQGHPELDQAAQSPIQPDLRCFQGWGIYHLSGQPVPVSPPSPQKKKLVKVFPLYWAHYSTSQHCVQSTA